MSEVRASPIRTLRDFPPEMLVRAGEEEERYYRHEHPGAFALSLFRSLKDLPDRGSPVDVQRHSLQTATRCLRAGESEELIVVALLHDTGEAFSTLNHGAVVAEILRPFISEENVWLLQHHPVFQEYYYADRIGRDHLGRERFRGHPHFDATLRFCEIYDQTSFDADYDELPLETFEPMVRKIFAREPYAQG